MDSENMAFDNYGVSGIYPLQISEDLTWRVGFASAQFFRSRLKGYDRGQSSTNRVIIARDTRPHSESLSKALSDGIAASGVGCIDIGQCDTPMLYFAVNHFGACGGVQVTASRMDEQYNGLKITGYKARTIDMESGLSEIERVVSRLNRMGDNAIISATQSIDLWDEYRTHVGKYLNIARPVKIVVDAANSVGGKMIKELFSHLAIEIVPLNFETKKGFAHQPDPLNDANVAQTCKAVVKNAADFGICLDGGGERCVFVDELGRIIRSDLMTALLAKSLLIDNPGALVVYDLRCSKVLPEMIRKAGGVPRCERVGFVKKAMGQGHGLFGGGVDGKYYYRGNFNCNSSAITIASLISLLSGQKRPLSELVSPLAIYSHSGEWKDGEMSKIDTIVRSAVK